MAVEAGLRQMKLFPQRIVVSDRELGMDGFDGLGSVYAVPVDCAAVPPFSGTTAAAMEGGAAMVSQAVKSDSGVTCAMTASRKRSRDVFNQAVNSWYGSGEDLSFLFLQQQMELDRFITQHTENLRFEIRERGKRSTARFAATVHSATAKRLKSKDEEIDHMRKSNLALEERLKSLCVENQILKELAQTNEATTNALRFHLEQLLAQVQDEQLHDTHRDADVESCCGSNFEETDDCDQNYESNNNTSRKRNQNRNRMCTSCGKEESCVLLLPCRHLCLCTVCGSSLHTCPVCNSAKTASVHVNLSAS